MSLRSFAPAVVVLALAALPACKKLETGAREAFSKTYSCPESRVETRTRSDLRVWDVLVGVAPEPAPEVKADPERLAVWTREQEKARSQFQDTYDLFEARGCDHQALLACAHPNGDDGETYTSDVACVEGKYPPGAARW